MVLVRMLGGMMVFGTHAREHVGFGAYARRDVGVLVRMFGGMLVIGGYARGDVGVLVGMFGGDVGDCCVCSGVCW